jgi:hypothetical protein
MIKIPPALPISAKTTIVQLECVIIAIVKVDIRFYYILYKLKFYYTCTIIFTCSEIVQYFLGHVHLFLAANKYFVLQYILSFPALLPDPPTPKSIKMMISVYYFKLKNTIFFVLPYIFLLCYYYNTTLQISCFFGFFLEAFL